MRKITINGKDYPIVITMGAYRDFKLATGKEVDQITGVSEMAELLFCIVKSSCRKERVEFQLSIEEFCDNLTAEQMELLPEILGVDNGASNKKKKADQQ